MIVGNCIYVKNSKDAVKLYMDAFELQLGYHVLNDDGSFYHSELNKDGRQILSVVESAENEGKKSTIVQLGIEFESVDKVKRAYELLSEGGTIDMSIGPLPWSECAAALIDKFGVYWYISAGSHYPDDNFDSHEPLR